MMTLLSPSVTTFFPLSVTTRGRSREGGERTEGRDGWTGRGNETRVKGEKEGLGKRVGEREEPRREIGSSRLRYPRSNLGCHDSSVLGSLPFELGVRQSPRDLSHPGLRRCGVARKGEEW